MWELMIFSNSFDTMVMRDVGGSLFVYMHAGATFCLLPVFWNNTTLQGTMKNSTKGL